MAERPDKQANPDQRKNGEYSESSADKDADKDADKERRVGECRIEERRKEQRRKITLTLEQLREVDPDFEERRVRDRRVRDRREAGRRQRDRRR